MQFADKTTLGQAVPLGLLYVPHPSRSIPRTLSLPPPSQRRNAHQPKPVQLARHDILSVLPRLRMATKPRPAALPRSKVDEVLQSSYLFK